MSYPGLMEWKLLTLVPVTTVILISPPAHSMVSLDPPNQIEVGVEHTHPVNPELLEIVGEADNVTSTAHTAVLREALKPVCACESAGNPYKTPQQFLPDGSVVRGIVNPLDIGQCQINLHYWGEEAEKLGYDVFTSDGNIRMANHIYDKLGLQPWEASKACWAPALNE
jgi:hypothetical protein